LVIKLSSVLGEDCKLLAREKLDKLWRDCKKVTYLTITLDRLVSLQKSNSTICHGSQNFHNDVHTQKLIRDLICHHSNNVENKYNSRIVDNDVHNQATKKSSDICQGIEITTSPST
jgi:hypothetical protein